MVCMYIKNSGFKELLIEYGKQEFLQYGYTQASLRRICSNAGITTGAVYSCFSGKEDLFRSIVGNTVAELKSIMKENCRKECLDADTTLDNDVKSMAYLWKNRDIIMILLDGSKGTCYENTLNEIEQMMVELFDRFHEQYTGKPMEEELLRIIVHSRLNGLLKILRGNYTLEKSLELAKNMSIYSNTGFRKLMENSITDNN